MKVKKKKQRKNIERKKIRIIMKIKKLERKK